MASGEHRVRATQAEPADAHHSDLGKRAWDAPTGWDQLWVADLERHEAFLDLAVVKGHRWMPVAAGV